MKAEDQSAEREAHSKSEYKRRIAMGAWSGLPPLPAPHHHGGTYESSPFDYFTAEDLREYARAALSARKAPAPKPFAWFTVDDITDRDGTPIGRDEPRFSWGEEPPEELGWTPLYLDPAPPAAKAVEMDAYRLNVLASFAHGIRMGAIKPKDLPKKAREALERTGLLSLDDVVALIDGGNHG